MKKLLLLGIVWLSLLGTGFAQSLKFSQLCDKYKGKEGVETFRLNGFVTWLASFFVKAEEPGIASLVRSCSSCEILMYDGSNGRHLSKDVESFIRSNALEELLTVQQQKEKVKIYVGEHKKNIRQVFIIVGEDSEMVLVHVKGKFSMAKVRELIKSVEKQS